MNKLFLLLRIKLFTNFLSGVRLKPPILSHVSFLCSANYQCLSIMSSPISLYTEYPPKAPKRLRPITHSSLPSLSVPSPLPENPSPRAFPVIVSFPNGEIFGNLSIAIRREFLKCLDSLFPNSHPRIGASGDLFVTPVNPQQKSDLLAVSSIGGFSVSVRLSKAECEHKRVLNGYPIRESTDEIVSELQDLSIISAVRRSRLVNGEEISTDSVIVTFSSPPPDFVVIAAKNFPLALLRWRPIQCTKCWTLGHSSRLCRNGVRCKICSLSHDLSSNCTSPPKCINCKSKDHPSDSRNCHSYLQKQKILDYAQKHGLSFHCAKSALASANYSSLPPSTLENSLSSPFERLVVNPPVPNFQVSASSSPPGEVEINEIRSSISNLQLEVLQLKKQIQPLLPLNKAVNDILVATNSNVESLKKIEDMLSPVIPVVQAISSDLPIIQQICQLIKNQISSGQNHLDPLCNPSQLPISSPILAVSSPLLAVPSPLMLVSPPQVSPSFESME